MRTNDQTLTLTHEELAQVAFMAAGAGASAVMRKAGDVVMPTEQIGEMLAELLREHGVEITTLHGYGQAVPA